MGMFLSPHFFISLPFSHFGTCGVHKHTPTCKHCRLLKRVSGLVCEQTETRRCMHMSTHAYLSLYLYVDIRRNAPHLRPAFVWRTNYFHGAHAATPDRFIHQPPKSYEFSLFSFTFLSRQQPHIRTNPFLKMK